MPDHPKNPSLIGRNLVRGESLVAWFGLAAAAVVVVALSGALALAYRAQSRSAENAETARLSAAAQTLATGVQSILSVGDGESAPEVSAARRMIMDAAGRHGFAECRVEFPDGATLVDADAKKGVRTLPEHWPAARPGETGSPDTADAGTVAVPLSIPGRGDASLVVRAGTPAFSGPAWEIQAGIGLIGVLSLAGVLVAYRLLRRRLGALLAIREALALAHAPECSEQTLGVSSDLGPEGEAWNAILAQRTEAAHRALEKRAEAQMSRVQGSEGDLATACDALSSGMILVDESCAIKYLNGAAAVFLGVKREDALGRPLVDFAIESDVVRMATSAAKGLVRTRALFESRRTAEGERRPKGPAEQPDDRRGNKTWGGGVLRFTVRPVRRDDAAAAT
ncbi:MAG: PAS domain-containing protein, partial [Phycisphaerales bacterium]